MCARSVSELFAAVAANPEADIPDRNRRERVAAAVTRCMRACGCSWTCLATRRVVRLCAAALPRLSRGSLVGDSLLGALNYAAAAAAAGVASQLPSCSSRSHFCALARAAVAFGFFATVCLLPTGAAAARELRRASHGGDGGDSGDARRAGGRDLKPNLGSTPPPDNGLEMGAAPTLSPPPPLVPDRSSGIRATSAPVQTIASPGALPPPPPPLSPPPPPGTFTAPPPSSPRTPRGGADASADGSLRRGWPGARTS